METKLMRTDSDNPDFLRLIRLLDEGLRENYGELQKQFDRHNGLEHIHHVAVLYLDGQAAGCGAFKLRDDGSAELKRIYVDKPFRGQGLSKRIVGELERWAAEEGITRAVLETGLLQQAAIGLYHAMGYRDIENFPPYVGNPNSLCMGKDLVPAE